MNHEEHDINSRKKMTGWEQLVFGVKLFSVAGLVMLLLWLVDRVV